MPKTKPAKPKSARKKRGAPKAKFSFRRHILPPFIGLAVTLLFFGALNAQWIIAQVKFHFSHQVATTSSPPADQPLKAESAASQVLIPKINVKAPVVFEPSFVEWKVQLALREGVLHYGSTANPGEKGNTVLFGHSSGQLWAPGNYKFIFTLLNKLVPGDLAYVDYHGVRYVYKVSDYKIVEPTDLSILNQSKEPMLTLVTCTPVGTSKQRLVVHAQQISPSPDSAPAAQKATPVTTNQLPGSAHRSLWDYLFGWL